MEPVVKLLELGLDGASRRQQALSNNIANVNTPDYKRRDVNFRQVLRQHQQGAGEASLSMSATHSQHLSGRSHSLSEKDFRAQVSGNTSYRNDRNNVDIDVEMAELAKNSIYYNTLTQQLDKKFSMLKNVINKGSN